MNEKNTNNKQKLGFDETQLEGYQKIEYNIIKNEEGELAIIEDPKKSRNLYAKIALNPRMDIKIAIKNDGQKLRIFINDSTIPLPLQPGFTTLQKDIQQTIPKTITYKSYIHQVHNWLSEFGKTKAVELTNKEWFDDLTADESKKAVRSAIHMTIQEIDKVMQYLKQQKALLEIYKNQK